VPPQAVRPALPEELASAFAIAFQRYPEEERTPRVLRALRLVEDGELSPEGVLVVGGEGGLVGALVCVALPGACGLLWPPQAASVPACRGVEDALVRGGLQWLWGRGARLAQALLLPEEDHAADALRRSGFRHVTGLSYMRHPLASLPDEPAGPALTYRPYLEADRALFHDTLLRSYEGTLDCPELNGVRRVEDVIEGHRAQGPHDPERWWLARLDGRPAGVVILNDLPDLGCWDLGYLGVVPEARRRGVGRAMTARAVRAARAAGAAELTLAVDVRNAPAWNLYTRLGFKVFDRREVYLAFFE
jgi:ribosomal protein S18 acetylase RimI-like enzyme